MQSNVKQHPDTIRYFLTKDRTKLRLKNSLKPEASTTNPLYHGRTLHNSFDPHSDMHEQPTPSDRIVNFHILNKHNNNSNKFNPEISKPSRGGISRRVILLKHYKNEEIPRFKTLQSSNCRRKFSIEDQGNGERSKTLPSLGMGEHEKKHIHREDDFSKFPKISRQDILNRRTSFQLARSAHVTLRRKSNSLIENRLMVNEDKYHDNRVNRFTKTSSFLKNKSVKTNHSSSTLEKRISGAKSVGDFSTVSKTLRNMTTGLAQKSSTLPKIVNCKSDEKISSNRNNQTTKFKESANRDAPIYGRIRRRQLSLPNVSKVTPLSNSTNSLKLSVERDKYSFEKNKKSGTKSDETKKQQRRVGERSLKSYPQEEFFKTNRISKRQTYDDYTDKKNDFVDSTINAASIPSKKSIRRTPWDYSHQSDNKNWYDFRTSLVGFNTTQKMKTSADSKNISSHVSSTLPLYTKCLRKSSNWISSSTSAKIASSKGESKIKSLTTNKFQRDNFDKKLIANHSKSLSDIHSSESVSPAPPSSSIFGFCTGRRKMQIGKKWGGAKDESVEKKKGELVWFDPGIGHVLPGEVLEYHRAANVLTVQAVIAGKPQTFTLTNLNGVRPRQDLGQNGVEDMIQLNDLNEASLLWNLKIRYDKELIYTYTGSILVAVNPYKMFDIYGLDQVKLYEGRILGTLPPHLFAVGSSAYSQVSTANNATANQVVVISGESGSGKTESTKLVMQYLAAVNRAPSNLVTEQILEAAPLLESFGNAKTPRNDNSSRFGKYLEVNFKDGVIVGGRVTQYLLEKSRIVTQAQDERNYHVFYELLAGLDQQLRDKYGLLTPDKYFYLNQGGNCEIDGKNDTEDFKALLSAMQVLGFTSEEQDTIFRILSSVLHLGNVYFHRKQMRHGQEGVEVGSDAEIRWAAHLLQINSDGIIRALTTKTTEARNEKVLTALNIDQALDARDAFAKALYSSLFSWLVARVNHIVYKGTKKTSAISILDIFGFENFTENSFEQLCINYANENLHFYFNKHIFKLEQQEYVKEKIDWTTINYTDNLPVIHLIAKKPVGILHLLDDESNFPKASDLSFLEKCHYNHALSELYSRPRMNSAEFAIKHYAGQVWYNVDGFLDKNRDTLRPDVVELLISSKIQMVSKMFQHVKNSHEANKTINKPNGRFVTMKPRTPTVSARFHDSLQQLLESMSQCNPWFVRCIKPNNDKAPMKYDMPCVLEQLRYTGMLETIRIRKTGYPVRLLFGQFVERYRYLMTTRLPRGAPNKELCRIILDKAAPQNAHDQYQLGITRVFLRESLERNLEYNRALILERAAITVQRYTRGFLARRRFINITKSAILLQAVYRGYRERKKYIALKNGAIMIQKLWRGKKQRDNFKLLKEEMAKRAEIERASRERARAKQQREEQEKASRAVAGVNHLEIPAELAFIYSKLDDWQPIHTERNLLKVVGTVIYSSINYKLPSDIDQYQFSKFTNIYFKSHIFGMKREPIKTPFLTKTRDQDYTDSLIIFKMILRFMNENNLSGKREQALGDYIVNKGIINEKLRDEILCQLANQTWKNENDMNKERGWLLIANCLSAFQPSSTLFKYLLKYVSDHAYNGYKSYCQWKLLQSERTVLRIMNNNQLSYHNIPRNYPPCLLEWRANRNRVNMALNVGFYDGETTTCAINSWTICEELANLAVKNHGVDNDGWTITLWNQLDGQDAIVTETNGLDYVLDLISEMELAPAFPAAKHIFLEQRKNNNNIPPIQKRETQNNIQTIVREIDQDMDIRISSSVLKTFQPLDRLSSKISADNRSLESEILTPKRPAVPPPQPPIIKSSPTRKQSHEPLLETSGEMGLSRQSALNDRYFENEKKQRSRSLDNLLQSEVNPSTNKLTNLGLSSSKLNERYHSLERIGESSAVSSNTEYMSRNESSQERKYSRIARNTEPNIVEEEDVTIDFEYPDIQSVSQTGRSEDDKGSYMRSQQTRFIKSQYPGKRVFPGSQSSRAYIEKSEYGVKSSAMSDTSEAPSLASHVRRVRVPSQASDVDQFLDELFMPVLDGNLDELSDARSLAASIKGTASKNINNLEEYVDSIIGHDQSNKTILTPLNLSYLIKGGGNMDIPNQNSAFNYSPLSPGMMSSSMMMPVFSPPLPTSSASSSPHQQMPTSQNPSLNMGSGFLPIPIYNMQGLSLPQYPNSPPNSQSADMVAYQQNLQRAFLQSAMAQNLQIQQQLLAQNQAFQQLLVQNGTQSLTFIENESGKQQQQITSNSVNQLETVTVKAQIHRSQSPPRKTTADLLTRKTSIETYTARKMSVERKISSTPELKRTNSGHTNMQNNFTNVLSELKNRKSSIDNNNQTLMNGKGVPPPPPMPPPLDAHDPSESRPFLDPYGRAKTVRIGKWRWPPPSDQNDNQSQDSFNEFKMRQHHQQQQQNRKITPQYQEYNQGNGDVNIHIHAEGSDDWEEFEIDNIIAQSKIDDNTIVQTTATAIHVHGHHKDETEKKQKNKKGSKSGLEVGAHRPSPGSIGKLKLSSEMRQRLEKVTANHSVRSTKTTEKPSLPRGEEIKINRLEDNRKLLLQQQLSGRWDDYASTADDTQSITSKGTTEMLTQAQVVRTQIERMECRPIPPPPPISPSQPHHQQSPQSGGSLYSNNSQTVVQHLQSLPAPIEPKNNRDNFRTSPDTETHNNHFNNQNMFSQSRDIFAASQHNKGRKFYGKDTADIASTIKDDRMCDFDLHRSDFNSDIFDKYSRDMFDNNIKRDSFRLSRDLSPKSRDSFGLPSSREFGVVPNTRESFVVARQSFKKIETDRRSSIASTNRTDKLERIEIEEWPEFLKPVLPPAEKPEIEKVQEVVDTKLYPPTSNIHFTYNRVSWTLRVKKEVFAPNETLSSPLALHLVFCQIAYDVLATSSIRITKEERQNMLKLLHNYGVTLENLQSTQHKITIKKNVVDMAKQWSLYFARIFPVSIGPQNPEAQHAALSHSGLRLLKRTSSGELVILETLALEDIVSVGSSKAGLCTLTISSGVRLPLHTTRASQLTEMIGNYIRVVEQKPIVKIHHDNHVSQISKSIQSQTNHINSHQNYNQSHNQLNHGNRDSSQSPVHHHAVNHSIVGNHHSKNQRNSQHHNGQSAEWRQPEEANKLNEENLYESGPVINDGKHSLLQYAILNFRQSTEKFEMMKTADGSISGSLKVIESLKNKKKSKKAKGQPDGTEWTWKEQVDLVKFSQVPIEQSLLRLEGEMSCLAAECFLCLMRYMGDQPLPPDMSEVKCVYTILMHCHRYEPLRDEVYCQLMKQTTNNKSPNPDSCQRGWRLFSIVAAYFTCSESLRPYLIKYLETAAYDKRRAYHGTATVCLQNLRKTVKYGGRKNVPSVEEIMAISAGRNAKRQIYRLPGGTERVINTKCTTVVQDVIEEMCSVISVRNPHEMDEFSLYCIVDGDAFTMPLARDEYVLDVTTELHKNHQVFYLIFCRSVWYYPLRLDAALYIEVVFNQIAPDYLEGLLLVIPGENLSQEVIYDMAQIAALLHRAADMPHEPSTKEIKYLLPKPALSLREPRPQQWGNMVQQAWNNIHDNTPAVCKAQVLEILSKWPLFGSSFFAVKRVPETGKEKMGDHILALNRHGVHFIDLITHETLYHYPYSEVISTRKVKSEEGTLYLDMKCGNLMQQRITRLQTEQAHEISRLIRQYITMEQRTTNNQANSMAYGLR